MDSKWKKYPIGKLYGHSVYIELPPNLSGKDHNNILEKSRNHYEEAMHCAEWVRDFREFIAPPNQ